MLFKKNPIDLDIFNVDTVVLSQSYVEAIKISLRDLPYLFANLTACLSNLMVFLFNALRSHNNLSIVYGNF